MESTTTTTPYTNTTVTSLPDNPLGGNFGEESVDAAWIIICTFIIFTMQSGFALLESGLFDYCFLFSFVFFVCLFVCFLCFYYKFYYSNVWTSFLKFSR